LSFLFATAVGAATFPPSADGESPAEVQRKTSRPLGANTLTQFARPGQPMQKRSRPVRANTLTQFAHPGFPVQKRSRPERANPPAAVRAPRLSGSEKGAAPSGRTRLRQFAHPGFPVQKIREIPKKFSRPKRQQKRPFSR